MAHFRNYFNYFWGIRRFHFKLFGFPGGPRNFRGAALFRVGKTVGRFVFPFGNLRNGLARRGQDCGCDPRRWNFIADVRMCKFIPRLPILLVALGSRPHGSRLWVRAPHVAF